MNKERQSGDLREEIRPETAVSTAGGGSVAGEWKPRQVEAGVL